MKFLFFLLEILSAKFWRWFDGKDNTRQRNSTSNIAKDAKTTSTTGQNPYGIKECWGRATGKLEKFRLIPIDLRPPYSHIKQQSLPTCYKRKRHVKVKAEALDSRGYWRS